MVGKFLSQSCGGHDGVCDFCCPNVRTKVMRNIVAGNWKSNKLMGEALKWMKDMSPWMSNRGDVEVMVAPPTPYLAMMSTDAPEGLSVIAQNVSSEGSGAHTGEYTAEMLKSCGVSGAIVGHSERRARFGDTDALVAQKVRALVSEELQAVFCCGETLDQREAGTAQTVVHAQLTAAILGLDASALPFVVVAYEPIWAIGTGKTASSEEAQAMHASIRGWMTETFGVEKASEVPILYGGSCKPSNAQELFSQQDINGGLIGGASLAPLDFQGVVEGHPASQKA
jgi:triosephosphate isomerase